MSQEEKIRAKTHRMSKDETGRIHDTLESWRESNNALTSPLLSSMIVTYEQDEKS